MTDHTASDLGRATSSGMQQELSSAANIKLMGLQRKRSTRSFESLREGNDENKEDEEDDEGTEEDQTTIEGVELPTMSTENSKKETVYLEARRHNSGNCQLRIVGQEVIDYPHLTKNKDQRPPRRFRFDTNSHITLHRFALGWTFTFHNCGVGTKFKPDSAEVGSKDRETRPDVSFHILYPEVGDFKHFDYIRTKDGGRDDFKACPVWDEGHAKHNLEALDEFNRRLDNILEKAGGTRIGRKKSGSMEGFA